MTGLTVIAIHFHTLCSEGFNMFKKIWEKKLLSLI